MSFSALQRAENSSTVRSASAPPLVFRFQCSSASRKFLNLIRQPECGLFVKFQCSSASRKFLNRRARRRACARQHRFSALQRAENSSTAVGLAALSAGITGFSALQRAENSSTYPPEIRASVQYGFSALQRAENSSTRSSTRRRSRHSNVSVLFSEPKIPQPALDAPQTAQRRAFQCSSASRKFLNVFSDDVPTRTEKFQCSSASRKFLKLEGRIKTLRISKSFSALQRAENSSTEPSLPGRERGH